MYGVSKINIEPSLMMISVQDAEFKGNTMARYLQIFADTGVVVDMISQSAPHGTSMDFSFTASSSDLPLVMKAISAANLDKDAKASPLISVGYSKLNLFGEVDGHQLRRRRPRPECSGDGRHRSSAHHHQRSGHFPSGPFGERGRSL